MKAPASFYALGSQPSVHLQRTLLTLYAATRGAHSLSVRDRVPTAPTAAVDGRLRPPDRPSTGRAGSGPGFPTGGRPRRWCATRHAALMARDSHADMQGSVATRSCDHARACGVELSMRGRGNGPYPPPCTPAACVRDLPAHQRRADSRSTHPGHATRSPVRLRRHGSVKAGGEAPLDGFVGSVRFTNAPKRQPPCEAAGYRSRELVRKRREGSAAPCHRVMDCGR